MMEDTTPPSFLCPVTLAIMEDPVSTVDEQTYERSAIQAWFESGHKTSPMTGLRLERNGALDLSLLPNRALKSAIEHWTAQQGSFQTIDAAQLRLNVSASRDLASEDERAAFPPFASVESLSSAEVRHSELGVGQDKAAYRGVWEGRDVALLLMRRGTCDTEARKFTRLGRHPHLVTFYGLAVLPSGKQSLVVELAPMGSLDNVMLDDGIERDLRGMGALSRSKMILEVVSQVCSGMMSVSSAGILHRDLALRNVMCVSFNVATGGVHVKVSDFGLSKEGVCYYGGNMAIPVRWTAPEALRSRRFSEKSDVWSFGVLVWELLGLARSLPYWEEQNDTALTMEIVEGKRTLQQPEGCEELLWAIARDHCLLSDHRERATFAALQLLVREKTFELHKREWEAELRGRVEAMTVQQAEQVLLQARGGAAAGAGAGEEQSEASQEARRKGLFERDVDEVKDYTVCIDMKNITCGWTPLMLAAHVGCIEDVVLLTRAGADVMKQDPTGASALLIASFSGHIEVVKHLVEKGEEKLLMLTATNGRSSLFVAAERGHLDVVEHLAEKGGLGLLTLTDEAGRSCLDAADGQGHVEVAKHLAKRAGELSVLAEKSEASQEARRKGLFEHDVDEVKDYTVCIDMKDITCSWTPLMHAAHVGCMEDVVLLTRAGADVMKQDPTGASCLHIAGFSGHIQVVKHLVEKGGQMLLMLMATNGKSSIDVADGQGHVDVVKYLAENMGGC